MTTARDLLNSLEVDRRLAARDAYEQAQRQEAARRHFQMMRTARDNIEAMDFLSDPSDYRSATERRMTQTAYQRAREREAQFRDPEWLAKRQEDKALKQAALAAAEAEAKAETDRMFDEWAKRQTVIPRESLTELPKPPKPRGGKMQSHIRWHVKAGKPCTCNPQDVEVWDRHTDAENGGQDA